MAPSLWLSLGLLAGTTQIDQRLADFRQNPNSGIPAEHLKDEVLRRLKPQ